MMEAVFLEGKKVILRAMEAADITGEYLVWINSQQADEYTEHAIFPNNVLDLERFFDNLRTNKNILHLAIVEKASGRHIGNISLQNINWISRRAEFAILIGVSDSQGKGLGYEASSLIIDHGFSRLNLNRLSLGVNASNSKALALYLKLGFVEEGRLRQHFFRNGVAEDLKTMGLLAEEWSSSLV